MVLPRRLARFNRVVTNRVFLPLAGRIPPWVVVEHVGRRSGRRYRTVVWAFPVPESNGLAFVLTYGSGADWVRNVVAARFCRVKRAHRWRTYSSVELVQDDAALDLVPPILRLPLRLAGLRSVLHVRP